MKDIKIRIVNKNQTIDIITRCLNLGYNMPLGDWSDYMKADFILIREHQNVAWCDEDVFISDLGEEMGYREFMGYKL